MNFLCFQVNVMAKAQKLSIHLLLVSPLHVLDLHMRKRTDREADVHTDGERLDQGIMTTYTRTNH